jgi:hypothetical protein
LRDRHGTVKRDAHRRLRADRAGRWYGCRFSAAGTLRLFARVRAQECHNTRRITRGSRERDTGMIRASTLAV